MLSTRTYDEFIAQTSALCGADFSTKEEARIMSLGNLAAKRAEKESQWWERLLVASEPRTASRGRVSATEDGYYVFGAGTGAVDGLYVRNGDNSPASTNPAYSMYDTDGTTELYSLFSDEEDEWYIVVGGVGSVANTVYTNVTSSLTPPSSGWEIVNGIAPAPLVTALSDIDTYMLISGTDSIRDSSSRPIRFYVDSSGANLRSNSDSDVVWVTYKKVNSDIYGDGNSGTTAAIPSEWFNYMTLYAAYMYQSSQRQNNPNSGYGLALREVENALQDELIRLEDQHITDNLAKNVYTHASQNNSLS